MALLEVSDLVVHYGKALALEDVSLKVERGELVGVLGPNGAGKTTLLKAISRTVPPVLGPRGVQRHFARWAAGARSGRPRHLPLSRRSAAVS